MGVHPGRLQEERCNKDKTLGREGKVERKRRKIRGAKQQTNQEKGEPSYPSGKFNEVDPLNFMVSSFDDEDEYPLARLLVDNDSEDSDDAPLAHYVKS